VTLGSSARDGEVEALVVDRYLDSLLGRTPYDTTEVPDELRATADRLATGLPRYHPSFRFVEDLAARLAAAGSGQEATAAVIDFPAAVPSSTTLDDKSGQVRPAVIGGVLTSAAISLAGAAAWMAWRRGRPASDPMSRALRAVARARVV
jgi:hypothetical protein